MKPKIKEVIVVEGRYDKNTLLQVVEATVVDLGGFGVFRDAEKLAFLRMLAQKKGLIIFTDPDGAGFVIRNYLKGALTGGRILQAYIPDIYGKEKRKRTYSKEKKLGVEGMSPEVILEALKKSGATIDDESCCKRHEITHADLLLCGLIGPDSSVKRAALLKKLFLPEHLSTKGLLEVLNIILTRQELLDMSLGENLA